MSVTAWTVAEFLEQGYGRRYLWIDFVNSEYPDGFGVITDYLDEESWRTAFLSAWGLPPISQRQFPLKSFRALRALLRETAEEIAEARVLRQHLIQTINESAAEPIVRSIERAGSGFELRFRPVHLGWKWVRSEIAASLGTFLASSDLHRLKLCANPLCRWAFFDETRGNIKRWCDDRRCGNRDKVRRHRAKQKT